MFGSSSKNSGASTTSRELPVTKTEPPTEPSQSSRTGGGVLSSGVSIDGDLTFRNELLIDGKVKGKINATGALTVGKNARIRGEVRTRSVIVQGTIEGNVFASERCVLESGATLHGDVESPRLAIGENAEFLGSAKITAKSS